MTEFALGSALPQYDDRSTNFLADSAELIGKIRIQKNASIWFGAVLRGDNEIINIGENSNIQDGCVLHTDMGYPLDIGKNCTIGHKVILHGCSIGENSLIGMGAIILNGAKIGKNCVVGAGALVAENKVVEDNTLVVGMPAKPVRQLSQAQIEDITRSAQHYVENGHRYLKTLVPK